MSPSIYMKYLVPSVPFFPNWTYQKVYFPLISIDLLVEVIVVLVVGDEGRRGKWKLHGLP